MRAPVPTFKRARILRREMTPPEVLLRERIRSGRLNGMRFRRLANTVKGVFRKCARFDICVRAADHFDAVPG